MGRLRTRFVVLFFSSLLLPHLSFSQSASPHGIDLTDLDRKADPCNDFYEFQWHVAGEPSYPRIHDALEQALGCG
jgi:hypothetical protein